MRQRGQLVPAGIRLEYVITTRNGHLAKQFEKVESYDYFKRHVQTYELDYLYYLKLLVNPLDQILDIIFTDEKSKGFLAKQYKYRWQIRGKMIEQIKDLGRPKIKFSK
jgi:DNA polymerase elongation subunit (family B)